MIGAVRSAGHPAAVIALNPSSLEDVLADIRRVGEATGREAEAEQVVFGLRERIRRVRDQAARAVEARGRPRVFCLEWLDPIYVSGHWIPEMVALAGGEEGLGRNGKPSVAVPWEAVVAHRPEVLILMPCGFDIPRTMEEIHLLTRRPGWREIPAVRDGRVFATDSHAYYNRSGPRLVDGLEMMAQMIHPEIFGVDHPPEAIRRLDRAALGFTP